MPSELISAGLGLLGGVLGTFVAPWVNWGIEKRRLQVEWRRKLMAGWRKLLFDVSLRQATAAGMKEPISFEELVEANAFYSSLKPHLSMGTLNLLRDTAGKTLASEAAKAAHDAMVQDVNLKERKWGLY